MAEPKEPEEIRQACVRKLKNIETSAPFTAMIACLLNENWTSSRILQLHLTPDHCLLSETGVSRTQDLVRHQCVPENVPFAIPWEELEKKIKVPASVKRIRGKLNVPRERIQVTEDGQCIQARPIEQNKRSRYLFDK
jgi:hypothetical protein